MTDLVESQEKPHERRDGQELRRRFMLLWEGRPLSATASQELLGLLKTSESEARELEYQKQLMLDA